MSGRAIILIVAGIIVTSTYLLYRVEATSTRIVQNYDAFYLRKSAENIAQSGVNMGLRHLAGSKKWRAGFPLINFLGGKVSVQVFDTTYRGSPVVAVRATGIMAYKEPLETRATSVAFVTQRILPPPPFSLVTSNGPTQVAGGFTIDARDHTPGGVLLPTATGVLGIWTTSSFTQSGSSTVGGTANGVNYAPRRWPEDSVVIRMNQPAPGGFPNTPDKVLGGIANGFPEGTLKSIAQSGVSGSQYVTDPALLRYPLSGVTYVELPSGGSWGTSKDEAVVAGSGIVVVRNSAGNALLQNTSNLSTFNGLIIADGAQKINSTFIGALVVLSPTQLSGNPHLGTGNGIIRYSSEAVRNAYEILLNADNKSDANVIAWWE